VEKQKEKIMRFSKVIYTLLSIVFIVLIVVAALQGVAWLWSVLQMNTDVVTISGVDMEAPLLFKLGDFKVMLPVMWKPGFDMLGMRTGVETGFGDLLATVLTIVGIAFAKVVFKLLRENGSPFREDVVKSLKRLAIVMLFVGAVSGAVPFLVAAVVWILCLIFEYGCMLQNENDTTQ